MSHHTEMQEARERVFAACRARGIAFLKTCTPENVARKIDEVSASSPGTARRRRG